MEYNNVMEKIWVETLKALEEKIDKNKFSVWIKPIKYKSFIDGILTLSVLNQASLSFVKQNFLTHKNSFLVFK